MDINIRALTLLEKVMKEKGIEVEKENYIYNMISNLQILNKEDISVELRELIRDFIKDVAEETTLIDEDSEILTFHNIMKTVVWEENENLIVAKYSKHIFNYGWNKLAKSSRGKVIDIKEKIIVSHAFNKFFNMGEVVETDKERIKTLIQDKKARVNVTDKKDGSTIIISKYKGETIINTNGSLRSEQIGLAKEVINKKYTYFRDNLKDGYTYVFELIHPANKIVIDYKEEALYLIAVRNLENTKLLEYKDLKEIAAEYKLDLIEQEEELSLFNIVEQGSQIKLPNEEKREGWVIRVITDEEDLMFKVKLEDYLELARLREKLTLKSFYSLYREEKIDDLVSNLEEEIKEEVLGLVDEVELVFRLIAEEIRKEIARVGLEYGLTENNFLEPNNRSKMIEAIKSIEKSVITTSVLWKLQGKLKEIDDMFNPLPETRKFLDYVDYINSKGIHYFDVDKIRILNRNI